MIVTSATNFRKKLFDFLKKTEEGETIIIKRNNQEVARLVPRRQTDWRNRMSIKAKLLVSPDKLIEPIEDIWDEYK